MGSSKKIDSTDLYLLEDETINQKPLTKKGSKSSKILKNSDTKIDNRKGNFSENQSGGNVTQNYFEGPSQRIVSESDLLQITKLVPKTQTNECTVLAQLSRMFYIQ